MADVRSPMELRKILDKRRTWKQVEVHGYALRAKDPIIGYFIENGTLIILQRSKDWRIYSVGTDGKVTFWGEYIMDNPALTNVRENREKEPLKPEEWEIIGKHYCDNPYDNGCTNEATFHRRNPINNGPVWLCDNCYYALQMAQEGQE